MQTLCWTTFKTCLHFAAKEETQFSQSAQAFTHNNVFHAIHFLVKLSDFEFPEPTRVFMYLSYCTSFPFFLLHSSLLQLAFFFKTQLKGPSGSLPNFFLNLLSAHPPLFPFLYNSTYPIIFSLSVNLLVNLLRLRFCL